MDRPPVWLMRQAGRYLPEYQALRKEHSFVECCTTPALAQEISLQPWRRFGMDGVVVFCDILMPLTAMGIEFSIDDGEGPSLSPAVTTREAAARLRVPTAKHEYHYVKVALQELRTTLGEQAAVIGFAGGPWTVAMYLFAGGRLHDRTAVKRALLQHRPLLDALIEKITPMLSEYLVEQMRAGAQVVQIFESWGGVLTAAEFADIAVPPLRTIIDHVHSATDRRAPTILYCNGSAHLMTELATTGADVLSIDHETDLHVARTHTDAALQGNLDPALLCNGTPDAIRTATMRMCKSGGTTGYIANLGHGVIKETPMENVGAFVETVQAFT
ncbi:MAG: uroporphyrinogen decarboxylase [Deltaproteobacteria bacterium]|nr:uroporphyrinogen decarboxylase [Deltaproteobacteria bacterium]